MKSKVSGFLTEVIAPEIQESFMAPALYRSFEVSLPLIAEINKAHLIMLASQGILERNIVERLLQVTLDLERDGADAFELDPAREDAYFNYEAEVIRRLGADIGGRMHVARSRNDLKSTLDRLRARDQTLRLVRGTLDLRIALIGRAEQFANVVMPGYTHLQPAQPITFGWYLLGVESALRRDTARLARCYERINRSPLGAGAIAGTSFPIDRRLTSALLGFDRPEPHAQDATACRDAIIELLAMSSLLTTTIGRMAQDFYYMTSYEFGTLELPDRVAITSSIMPQKKNMAALENLKGCPAIVTGALVTALAAHRAIPFSHTQEASINSMRWTWDALDEVILALPAARVVVEAAEPKPERMLELVQENYSTATELADMLVRSAGLSFRQAHHVVGRVVRLAMEKGLRASEVSAALVMEVAERMLDKPIHLSEADVSSAMDPQQAVEGHVGSGGPASGECQQLIAEAEEQLSSDQQWLEAHVEQIRSGRARLDEAVQAILANASVRDDDE